MEGNRVRLLATQLVVSATVAMTSQWSIPVAHAQRVATTPTVRTREGQRVTVNVDSAPLVSVLHSIARQAGLVPFMDETLIPATARVTLHLREVSALDAFQQALRGTGLMANVHERGDVIIVPAAVVPGATGIITGRVIDAKTKQPLRGATIGLDGANRVVATAENGTYRLPNVSAGPHTVTVKLLGYTKATRTATVQDDATTTMDVTLELAASPLDQVVVTGTVIPTELKAVPNAITVITAKQIEERGITKIDQLFRGDVPGLFTANQGSNAALDEVNMFSRGATALSSSSAGVDVNTGNSNPIKTYVDGVELADPRYLSQIDPRSIERIEILAGPQASTIYGSNAINGVMQIFTKRGTSNTPQLALNLMSGWVENNSSSAKTPQHDYSGQVNGFEGRVSYNVGGSWNYVGAWTPAKQTARTSGFGGAKLELPTSVGRVTADMTLRRGITQNRQRGAPMQTLPDYQKTGWYTVSVGTGLSKPTTYLLTGQTLGLVFGYVPASWWSHELEVGSDVSDTEQRYTARGYFTASDTTLYLQQGSTDRRSLRYATTARVPITSLAQATVTLGADTWQKLTSSVAVSPLTLTGSLTGTTTIRRQPEHNTGGFVQAQLGVKEQLFFTYGLRAEWNPAYGEEAQPNYAPRYGLAYTRDVGPVTAKLRGSYGSSTRPPIPGYKGQLAFNEFYDASIWAFFSPYYANGIYSFANPDLGPEHQQGGEGGLELYLGTRASLVVTRYNQTVNGLIAAVNVDSLRSQNPNPGQRDIVGTDGYGYMRQYQYVNIGSIRNQGWELQGSMNIGPFTTRGTYSWTKSRTIGVDPKYRSFFTPTNFPQYQPGATFQYLPEHTWAAGVTYARAGTTMGLNVMGTGRVTNFGNDFFYQNIYNSIRLSQNKLNMNSFGKTYIDFNRGYATADLTASQRFSQRVEGVLQVQNLTDQYTNDYNASYATMGRQVKAGFRLRAQ